MKYIDKRSISRCLKQHIEIGEKDLNDPDPGFVEQTKEFIAEWKHCLESKEADDLINEWNNLVKSANSIKSKAKSMNTEFAKYFRD